MFRPPGSHSDAPGLGKKIKETPACAVAQWLYVRSPECPESFGVSQDFQNVMPTRKSTWFGLDWNTPVALLKVFQAQRV
jgi:hypothetical protein